MKIIFKYNIHTWLFFALLAFPMFYFVYKHLNLQFGYKDFNFYNFLYTGWDLDRAESPYNLRLISSYLVHLLTKLGVNYPTETTFETIVPGGNKSAFFSAIFVNFICLVTTSVVLYRLVQTQLKSKLNGLLAGIFLLLGFGTIFYLLPPLTDCLSVLFFALVLICYEKRNYWIALVFLLSVFQREYIFICFGLLSLFDYFRTKEKYFLVVLVLTAVCFLAYIILRKTLFYSPRFASQLSASGSFVLILEALKIWKSILMQTCITMNIVFVYCGTLLYKKYHGMQVNKGNIYKLVCIFLVTMLVGLASKVGNNAGRVFYLCIPLVIYFLCIELKPVLEKLSTEQNIRVN